NTMSMSESDFSEKIDENGYGDRTAQQQRLLRKTIQAIRQSTDIEAVLKSTAEGLRHLIKADRVAIYRFEADWSGQFVAESYEQGRSALLEKQINFPAITENISNCSAQLMNLETGSGTATDTHLQNSAGGVFSRRGTIRICNDIYSANFSQCYIDALELYEARAYVISSLHSDNRLWGLLAAYQCDRPREWTEAEAELLEQISIHLGVAIQQNNATRKIKQQTVALKRAAARQKALDSTIDGIRRSLDIKTIFDTTTQGMRDLIQVDRVAIYKFNPDWSGEFVAESFNPSQNSLINKQRIFPEMREKAIDCGDANSAKSPENSPEGATDITIEAPTIGTEFPDTHLQETQGGAFTDRGAIRVCNDIYAAGFSDCYINILEKYEAKAYVIGALHSGDKLWGLLAAFQSTRARQWTPEDSELVEQVSNQLGLALQQAEAIAQIKQQKTALNRAAERQQALTRTIDKIRQSLDIQEIFDTATYEIRQLLRAHRVAIYQLNLDHGGRFVTEAFAGEWVSIMDIQKSNPESIEEFGRYAVQWLQQHLESQDADAAKAPSSAELSETLRTYTDIYQAEFPDSYIRLLERCEVRAYTISALYRGDQLWGVIIACQNDHPRSWTEEEASVLDQVSNQLSIALKQHHTLTQVSQQAANLKKAAVRQAALAKTIDRIRHSLNIDQIFKATTKEVRQLLDVERVAIYRFSENWTGAFVADSIVDGWQPSMPSHPVVETVLSKPNSEGNYPRNEVFVPIIQGEKLWGLLMAYQNSTPRYWDEDEIALLNQVGGQLAIAISQAELLEQTRTQAELLNKALQDLKQTQAQIVQGEKMAGLSQLMAGIAHEINNPVGFIFSNAEPAREEINDLITILNRYRAKYPELAQGSQGQAEENEIDFIAKDLPRLIDSMETGATRIRDIMHQLKVFSRKDEEGIKAVDIHTGIDSTLLVLAHRLRGDGDYLAIQVTKEYGNLPQVSCHPRQINQVVMSLLNNAIEALDEEHTPHSFSPSEDQSGDQLEDKNEHQYKAKNKVPQIRITTEWLPEAGRIAVNIGNNGPRVPEEHMASIFDPFFTTKPVGKGTGLGLSIGYQIITDLHRGSLVCQSDDEWTCFRIELPIECTDKALNEGFIQG
ncbi:MAG: GAF domain-containing protein, partial [Cyanobacteria bacterium P01_D01_bin.1]